MSTKPSENTRRTFLKTAARGSVAVISLSSIASGAMAIEEIHRERESTA